MNYRPDIDGLRAVAVLSVVWHHYSPKTVPGGFVGVDIFFVISGFLITHQILIQISKGVWSFANFYRQRINRIIPALWVVSMVCVLVGGGYLSPSDWVLLAKSSVAALLGVSNIFFWREYGNYFGGDAKEALLLHTWSLGVEEQFYILWPVILLAAVRLSKRWFILLGISLLFMAIVFSDWAVGQYASASYYLLPTRFFELMLGGLLAWWLLNRPNLQPSLWFANVMVLSASILLVVSLWGLSPQSPFPGWRALIPTLAAVLIIWAGLQKHWGLKILTHPYLMHVGVISYSFYLWHWPILAWINYHQITVNNSILWFLVAISFFLAELTWRFVEQPIRQSGKKMTLWQTITKRFAPAALALIMVAGIVVYTSGFQSRFSPLVASFEANLKQRPEKIRKGCHVPSALYSGLPSLEGCRLGAEGVMPSILLWGDSYANHFSGAINVMAKKQGLSVVDYTMDACPPILDYQPVGVGSSAQKCVIRNQQALNFLMDSGIKHVILAANWPNDNLVYAYIKSTFDNLQKMGFSVTFIHQNQGIPLAQKCSIQRALKDSSDICGVRLLSPPNLLQALIDEYPTFNVFTPSDVMCEKGWCDPVQEGILLYRDSGHLNNDGSHWLGLKWFDQGKRL